MQSTQRPAQRPATRVLRAVSVLSVASLALWAATSAAPALAASPYAISGVGINQNGYYNLDLDSAYSSNGAPISSSLTNKTFTGMNRVGAQQTMSYSAVNNASASFYQLHLFASGSVTNNYYNAANKPANVNNVFDPTGSPDGFYSLGFAGFNDTLQYGGALQSGYMARYLFHVDGNNSGYGGKADLSVTIAGHNESFFAFDGGSFDKIWATQSYPVNGITPQDVNVQFSNQFTMTCSDFADGDSVSGSSNFSNTLTFAGIEITDANGNHVDGVTVTGESGTTYNTSIPEPALLSLAAPLLLLARRRQTSR